MLKLLGRLKAAVAASSAIAALESAVAHAPGDADAWTRLAILYDLAGRHKDASQVFERVVGLVPQSPHALHNYGMSLKDRGLVEDAVAIFRRTRQLAPDNARYFSTYLSMLNYNTRLSPAEIFREHLEFDRHHGSSRFRALVRGPRPQRGKLRIGYLSPDLRGHPIHCFVEPVLAHHDRAQFEVSCYYLWNVGDQVTERLRQLSDHWIECSDWDEAKLADRIVADRIDILVDLAGHTAGNKMAALGRKPAPVIAAWLGYPNTTGLRTVDYRITDAVCDPAGAADSLHAEKLERLPGAQWCFLRPAVPVRIAPAPALRRGAVTFGSFNNEMKVTQDMLSLWADVLRRVSGSRLLLWGVGDEHGARMLAHLQRCGIEPGRIEVRARTSFARMLDYYQRVDIALDTQPYSGVTTTFNALWMGVPVLTVAGNGLPSRSTLSILSALGLQDWCAASAEDFVQLAARKAGDLADLGRLRATLRARLEESPLMDGRQFTAKLEDAYRRMWQARAARQ